MAGDASSYLGLITSRHADKPNFMATVAASVQPFADTLATLNGLNAAFDLDLAQGNQLDILGEWIGASRYVASALDGVYFSFDVSGLGLDQGVIWSPGEPLTGLIALPDDVYLTLLRATIVANHWDGSIPDAYTAWQILLGPQGYQILIQDNGDMTMVLALHGALVDPVFTQLFAAGVLNLRPAGVEASYVIPTIPAAPFFGLDIETDYVAGLDFGAFGQFT